MKTIFSFYSLNRFFALPLQKNKRIIIHNHLQMVNKQILRLALPSMVSNITVPLLALVDVAIVGHLGAAAYIGAIAVGGTIFNVLLV